MRTYNIVGVSDYTPEVTSTVLPLAPSSLGASAVSDTRIDLTWSDNSAGETAYRLERKTGTSGTWGEIATLEPNVMSYSDTGLAAPVTYVYRVRAANPAGSSTYSNEASATTLIPPSAPTNLTASTVSATRILLIWEDRSDNEWEFQIERKTDAGGTWAPIATAPANAIIYADNVTTTTGLFYRVRAVSGAGSSGYSNEAMVTERRLAAGADHSLLIGSDGSLWAWGSNSSGQLGDGTTTARTTPTPILTGVATLAAGSYHTLALKTDGSLWAWGYNYYGQLGDGTTTNRSTPTQVLTGVAAIAAGGDHTLALKTDGSLWAWGANGYGQLGDGTTTNRSTPKQVLTGVAAIAAGGDHTLALKTDGSLWAWGS